LYYLLSCNSSVDNSGAEVEEQSRQSFYSVNTPSKSLLDPVFLRILIVDDVKLCRKMLMRLLQREDCICVEAADGEEAILKIDESRDRGMPIHGVFMDALMPGMGGPAAVKLLREGGFRIPIYGLTGMDFHFRIDSNIYIFLQEIPLRAIQMISSPKEPIEFTSNQFISKIYATFSQVIIKDFDLYSIHNFCYM
jgi:CheY-like chemotaxis protein